MDSPIVLKSFFRIPGADIPPQEIIFPLDNCRSRLGTCSQQPRHFKFQSVEHEFRRFFLLILENAKRGIFINHSAAPEIWTRKRATSSFTVIVAFSICARISRNSARLGRTMGKCATEWRWPTISLRKAGKNADRNRDADEKCTNTSQQCGGKLMTVRYGEFDLRDEKVFVSTCLYCWSVVSGDRKERNLS